MLLNPEQVGPPGKVQAREGVSQPVRLEVAIASERAANQPPEDPRPGVGLVDVAALVIWEDERLVAMQVGLDPAKCISEAARQLDAPLPAALGWTEVTTHRVAPADAGRPRVDVYIRPAQRDRLAQAGARISQEEDQDVMDCGLRGSSCEQALQLRAGEDLIARDLAKGGAATLGSPALPRLDGIRLDQARSSGMRQNQPKRFATRRLVEWTYRHTLAARATQPAA